MIIEKEIRKFIAKAFRKPRPMNEATAARWRENVTAVIVLETGLAELAAGCTPERDAELRRLLDFHSEIFNAAEKRWKPTEISVTLQ